MGSHIEKENVQTSAIFFLPKARKPEFYMFMLYINFTQPARLFSGDITQIKIGADN